MPGALLTEESAVVVRALVVQSRSDVARAVSVTLADAGIEALTVADGFAAADAIAAWDPHVVLVDLTLAPLDGWYVLAFAAGRPGGPLVVARVADPSEAERAIALGADAWVDSDVHVVAEAGRLMAALAA